VTQRQRRTYEAFLSSVPLLAGLDAYDRSAMADCLLELSFDAGQAVIRQGDAGDAFYLLLEGDAAAVVADAAAPGGVTEVMQYTAVRCCVLRCVHREWVKPTEACVRASCVRQKGMYFGEVALLRDEPRKASVLARSACRVAKMERDAFRHLLARPLKAALDRQLAAYSRPHDEKYVR
jgi:cAMP-dependent protein kinase regulator